MVLDIRHLWSEPVSDILQDSEVPELPDDLPEPSDDLGELLRQAATGASLREQVRAVAQLRQIVPGTAGIERLWEVLATDGDPRRLVAAQVLGYHRSWLASRSSLRQVLVQLRQESDSEVGAALVWCLRQRDEIQEFLRHENPRVAREAALNLPLNRHTLARLLQVLVVGQAAEIERILLHKLRSVHPSLMPELVDHLLQEEWRGRAERLVALFECLPQVPLFEIFLGERQLPDWDPQQGFDQTAAVQNRHHYARMVEQVLQHAPTSELLRYLLNRSGEDEAFARRHAAFLRAVLRRTDGMEGSELLKHFERLSHGASEDKVVRLAQLLIELSGKLGDQAGTQAGALLESWMSRSAALKLKIYQLQQGLV